ncbi:MAG: glycoside hydrolase family 3 N-terminal domain-containing protein [Chloroflexota bacterium]|jgi:beta-N-acetylhexosaminidase
MRRIGAVLIVALAIVGCSIQPGSSVAGTRGSTTPATLSPTHADTITNAVSAAPTLAQLIGQKLVVRMSGTTPSADLLGRIERGEIGGVILFGSNIIDSTQLRALTGRLQAAASTGGQPRLLIAVDQEGGSVRHIPWAPPTMSARQMGIDGRTSVALAQGTAAGSALHGLGLNVDFAPVADVPVTTKSFMYRAGRTFSFYPSKTSRLANAFATGLMSKGVAPTMKHFPGIGRSRLNTDQYAVTLYAGRTTLAAGLVPYQTAIAKQIPLIMLSNATYTAYDTVNGAGWSHAISIGLLRNQLGFTGVSITDSLTGTAKARGIAEWRLAVRAARAGTDMILVTDSEASTRLVYSKLMTWSANGSISRALLQASYQRILALKAGF